MALKKWELEQDKAITEEDELLIFGGQDRPDNVLKLQKRVADQELIIVDMHIMIKDLKEENKEHVKNIKSFKKANKIAFELLNEIWEELNSGTTKLSLESYRGLQELCS